MSGVGNESQTRIIAEQVAEATLELHARKYPPAAAPIPEPKADIPAPLKWAAAIICAIMSAGAAAMCIWVVSTLSDLQQTVTRIDERQQLTGDNTGKRLDKIEERLMRLEQHDQERPEK